MSTNNIENASRLLGIETNLLIERLQTKTIKVGNNIIKANLSIDDAYYGKDNFCKTIYHRLFLYLVEIISSKLGNNDDNLSFIGILDIFGFESFTKNSLEQLLINWCNEQLQSFFNSCIIISEQQEYLKEGLSWNEIVISSNIDMKNLMANPKNGIFSLLDTTCLMPKGTVDAFYHLLFKQHSNNKLLIKNRKRKNKFEFSIIHYAETVNYDSSLFLVKNRDTVHQDTITLLSKSKSNLIVSMMENDLKKSKKR